MRGLKNEIEKPWRSCPELDCYTDERAKLYLREAIQTGTLALGLCKLGASLFPLMVLIALVRWIEPVVWSYLDKRGVPDPFLTLIEIMAIAAITVAFGWPCVLVNRRVNRIFVQRRMQSTECFQCGYSLLGLEVRDGEDGPEVQCPECNRTEPLSQAQQACLLHADQVTP